MKKGRMYQVSIDEIEYQPHFIMVYASEDAKDKDLQRLANKLYFESKSRIARKCISR